MYVRSDTEITTVVAVLPPVEPHKELRPSKTTFEGGVIKYQVTHTGGEGWRKAYVERGYGLISTILVSQQKSGVGKECRGIKRAWYR